MVEITQCNSIELRMLKELSGNFKDIYIHLPVDELLTGEKRTMFNAFLTTITKVSLRYNKHIDLYVDSEKGESDVKLYNKIMQVGHRLQCTGVTLVIEGNTCLSMCDYTHNNIRVVQLNDR